MRRGAGWLLALALLSCASGPGPGRAPSGGSPSPLPSIPVGRSEHPVPGRLSWRLGSVAREGTDVVVDLDLENGTSSGLRTGSLALTLHGPKGQSLTQEVMVGPIAAGRSKRIVARVTDVSFQVTDLTVELLAGLP